MSEPSATSASDHPNILISSTALDLPEHRKAAIDACWRLGLFPQAMERDPATYSDPIAYSLQLADLAQAYVGIFAFRYGYVPAGYGESITEMELRRAEQRQIDRLIFIMDPNHPIRGGDAEVDPEKLAKLNQLKDELKTHYVVKLFTSPNDLGTKAYEALTQVLLAGRLNTQAPSAGVHAPTVAAIPLPPAPYLAHPYIQAHQFFGRQADLAVLDAWARSGDPMMFVEAIGGIGKSALTWQWARQRAVTSIAHLAGMMWWSFYESDATVGNFVRHALAYVAHRSLTDLDGLSAPEREEALLAALREQPYLLVLDGLERILVAYHRMDAARLNDEQVAGTDSGKQATRSPCTDPRHGEFLRKLLTCAPSRILISTRLVPQDLYDRSGQLLYGARHHHLNGLDPQDAVDLMRHLGVHGDAVKMQAFMAQFGYHSLVLGVLAGRIVNYRSAPGNFEAWLQDEGARLRLSDLALEQRRTHILSYALQGLTPDLRKLLSQIAAFRYPIDYAALNAINPYAETPSAPEAPPYPVGKRSLWDRLRGRQPAPDYGQTMRHWQAVAETYEAARVAREEALRQAQAPFHAALTELEGRGLLQWDRSANRYDLHPVVRAYAFEQLQGDERRRTFDRIRDHFEALPPEDTDHVREVGDLRRTLELYHALVGAGRLDDAARVYGDRLSGVLHFNLAAYHAIIELLLPLFPDGPDRLPALSSPVEQSDRLQDLAGAFARLGNTQQALSTCQQALGVNVAHRDSQRLAVHVLIYQDNLRSAGELAASLRAANLALDLARAADDRDGMSEVQGGMLNIYRSAGQWAAAEEAYQRFIDRPPLTDMTRQMAEVEILHASMLIYQGLDATQALDRARELATQARFSYGQREILRYRGELALSQGAPEQALPWLQDALTLAQKSGVPTFVYRSSVARSLAMQGRGDPARLAIEEVMEQASAQAIAHSDHLTLLASAAEVYASLGDKERARTLALQTYRAAWADGPPFSWWWQLERARRVLARLQVAEPVLPPYDPARVRPIPYEREIRAYIAELERR